nr:hypothetical protein CKG001_21620 [Bdellovibrio sp. CKG001]BFD63461.1 hypothetical protein BdHM001_21420 [Bdellovibrio sp. HM001]
MTNGCFDAIEFLPKKAAQDSQNNTTPRENTATHRLNVIGEPRIILSGYPGPQNKNFLKAQNTTNNKAGNTPALSLH